MDNLGFGPILLLVLFILVPLINFLIRRGWRHVESEAPEDEPVLGTPGSVRTTSKSPPLTYRASPNEVHASQALTVATQRSRSRFSRRSLLGNTRDVRRGMIIMTILGPCRAFDPPD